VLRRIWQKSPNDGVRKMTRKGEVKITVMRRVRWSEDLVDCVRNVAQQCRKCVEDWSRSLEAMRVVENCWVLGSVSGRESPYLYPICRTGNEKESSCGEHV